MRRDPETARNKRGRSGSRPAGKPKSRADLGGRSRDLVEQNRHLRATPRGSLAMGEPVQASVAPGHELEVARKRDKILAEQERRPAGPKAKKPSAGRESRRQLRRS